MTRQLATITRPGQAVIPVAEAELARRLEDHARAARGALSPNTERALRSDVRIFTAWCAENGRQALPASPETVAAFIDVDAEVCKPASVRRHVASIAAYHRAAGLEPPTRAEAVRLALKRLARANGSRQRQASPLNRRLVERMIEAAGDGLRGLRDRALLAAAYDTLARRSELVALGVTDITLAEDGTGTVTIRRSKTDQEGQGSVRFIAADTCEHVKRWLEASQVAEGPLFRSVSKGGAVGGRLDAGDVARAFKRLARAAGIEASVSGHSTRVGAAQDLVAAGLEVGQVMQAGGWKTPAMVARYCEHLTARRGAMARLAALQNRA